ncbi:DEAD/DEAH box helicase family protein [Helicobacter pylori]|uniref:DEAD/DEAH box helicase family protein n=1 Tax=Helicobacter pylori TaxID=210 RepID=UPI0002BAC5A1|nr:DEAD/DEAH box helicase family protein [Helicobacter pylori]EMH09170.1 type III restriction enzyme, res subunit [Helicobacter pylori GAM250AFi]EMH12871.1 type III restriction enzyme, res subunit [Helicobacter pylori GAM252T]EMH14843.1 type III restriction enzyme, res subunit [Helicobacter pylori GAM252Bi]EMH15578.1 type III restriction enzyme, res subunit [Helicobacter pylori GAM250T]EMH45980.1 type III restriction enzyme, res subunit [Helicobacter pylori HP250AFii]
MAKKKQEVRNNEIFVAQKLAEEELNANEINEPLEMLDFKSFDNNKELLDYQQQALINAFRVLVAYFRDFKENKKEFYAFYQKHYSFANCDFAKKKLNHLLKSHFKVENHCVRFENFINRLAFYMATGSGKTIVIIKLVELLSVAMGMGLIPKKNIMFFSANENLIKQFEKEIEKYNRSKDYSKQIDFKNLKSVKNKDFYHSPKDFFQKIALFYYRADLMSDEESKENLLNYKDCWDNGENYVILDEAHKGNKTESKRQAIFSLLSQKGFLFNFSATFTEESDLITAVYNLSVGEWVKLGYGKESVLLKKNNLSAFKELKDLNDREKEIALLKALLLLGMQKRYKTDGYFHDPLMLVFTHSVNVENSDAEIFFKTLARVIENDDESDFLKAKDDLLEELKNPEFLFSDGKDKEKEYKIEVFKESLKGMDFKGLKEEVFYASSGHIEVIINPKNNQEIAFKLNTSDKVFCLIRIGDITEWIREKLKSVKVVSKNLSFKEESYFSQIDKSSINILVGSRAFDTGWDSTRPSVILFLNIGLDDDAKKLVKQSFGRGVRIESVKNQRQRLAYLDIDEAVKEKLKPNAAMLETLFVIAAKSESVKAILDLKEESSDPSWCEVELEKTPIEHALFVPCYREKSIKATDLGSGSFKMSEKNFKDLKEHFHLMSEKHFILKHEIYNPKDYELLKDLIQTKRFEIELNWHYKDLDDLISILKKRLYLNQKVPKDEFDALDDEKIVHFKRVKVKADKKEELIQTIQEVKEYAPLDKETLIKKIAQGEIDPYDTDKHKQDRTFKVDEVELLKLKEHYYTPLIKAKNCDWLKHVVKVKSESDFLEELLKITETLQENYDFWAFSKIDEHLDNLFIPYIDNSTGERKFFPDFIFWLQKGGTQIICFIDPKGTKHTDYEHKADAYQLFEDKVFNPKGDPNLKIKVVLKFYGDKDGVGERYRDLWIEKGKLEYFFLDLKDWPDLIERG